MIDDPVRDVNGRLFIHDDEQLKKWKEYFNRVLKSVTSVKVLPLLDEMASQLNMRIPAVEGAVKLSLSPMRSKRLKLDRLLREYFITAVVVLAGLLLQLIRKSSFLLLIRLINAAFSQTLTHYISGAYGISYNLM